MAHVIVMTQFNGRSDVILCGKVESSLFKAPCGLWRTGSYRDVIATNFSKISLNQSWQCRLQISEERHLQARVRSEWNRLEGFYLLAPVTGLYDKVFLFTLDRSVSSEIFQFHYWTVCCNNLLDTFPNTGTWKTLHVCFQATPQS